jgi:Tfp pilus assembly protein PilF
MVALLLGLAGCGSSRAKSRIDPDAKEMKALQARSAYERGIAHIREGQPGAALSAVQEAATLDPSVALYENTLGVILLQLRQLDGARASFARALQIDPAYGDAQLNHAVAAAEGQQWEQSVEEYRKALRMPTLTTPHIAHHNLGVALLNLKRYAPAEESLRFAISLEPEMIGAHYNLGLVLLAQNRAAEARAAFRRARELAPDSHFGQAAAERLKALGDGG